MNWIDWAILILALVAGFSGYVLGLSGVLLNSIATGIGYVGAFLLAAPVKNLLESVFHIVSGFAATLAPFIPGTKLPLGTNPIDVLKMSGLPDWSKNIFSRIADSNYIITSTSDIAAYWIANIIIVIIVFIVLLILLGFLARWLIRSIRLSLPQEGFIHDFDRWIGSIIYLLITFFVCIGVLIIFSVLFPKTIAVASPVGSYVVTSFFGALVYNNFLGVQTLYASIVRFVIGY